MSITWFNDKAKDIVATITSKSITINKVGSQFFETANQVMLGYDLENKLLLIKPLSKKDVLRGDVPEHTRYNISMNVSYARISNKVFLEVVDDLFSLNLSDKGIKYKANWRMNRNVFEISLKEVL